ncbi:MAG: SDR family NAD(P)-dependent oxidoreductase [Deltaproteobacteria bacterium]|nr:SDR family NAD(P)-dependent oxidoreductase [Deltaproteobacteria bacterium]
MAVRDFFKGKAAVITGASSGIGKDLALLWAQWGCRVGLVARREDLLERVAEQCREAGVDAMVFQGDVTDREAMERVRDQAIERFGFVDIVVANAGVGGLNPASCFDLDIHRRTMEINCVGVANTLVPFIPSMIEKGDGILTTVSSLSGFRGLPKAASYSSSKAMQGIFMESLRVDLRPHGVHAFCIHPGFIETPMTEHDEFTMPFKMPVRRSSMLISKAIARRRRVYLYPWPMKLLTWVNMALPRWLYDRVLPVLSGQKDTIKPRLL